MLKILSSLAIFFACGSILQVHSLLCYQCVHCTETEKVECNPAAVQNLTTGLEKYFYNIPNDASQNYDCITVGYMTKNHHAKIRGCIYDNTYACSIKPKNYSISYICGTCDTDFCNSLAAYTSPKVALTLIATALVAIIARIL